MNFASVVDQVVVKHTEFKNGLDILVNKIDLLRKERIRSVVALSGDSGVGKTFLMKALIKLQFEKKGIIKNHDEAGLVLPFSVARIPSNARSKAFIEDALFIYEVDDTQGTSERWLRHRLTTLIKNCKTELLVIEELNRLADRRTEKFWREFDDLLISISDDTNCVMVVSGLSGDTEAVIARNEQFVTRIDTHIELPRFQWSDSNHQKQFGCCLREFHKQLSSAGCSLPVFAQDSDWPFRMYCATGGIMRLLANFLKELVSGCGSKKQIELADFDTAYRRFGFRWLPSEVNTLFPFAPEFLTLPQEKILPLVDKIGREVTANANERKRGSWNPK